MPSITIENIGPSGIIDAIQRVVRESIDAANHGKKPLIPLDDPNTPPTSCRMVLNPSYVVQDGKRLYIGDGFDMPSCAGPCETGHCVFYIQWDGGTRKLEFGCRCVTGHKIAIG
jgi:hypothetical protein